MTKHLTIELSEPIATALRDAVEAGGYASAAAVVQDALRLWLSRNVTDVDRLRAAWDDGKASGIYGPVDFEDLRREAQSRLAFAVGHGE